jgi:hypothetical protein
VRQATQSLARAPNAVINDDPSIVHLKAAQVANVEPLKAYRLAVSHAVDAQKRGPIAAAIERYDRHGYTIRTH